MGIKRNFIFSSALTVSGYFFPLIVYPHVARALGLEHMGMCNFVDGIIDYFCLFSMLGIASVGVREIAEVRSNHTEVSRRVKSIIAIGSASTLLAIAILIICTFSIPALHVYRPLLLIGIIKLTGNFLLLDWLYQGLENFKYITLRTISVKAIYTIAVYILIWAPDDYITYYLLFCLSFGINALLSCMHALKIIDFKVKGLEIRRLLKPIGILALYMCFTSLYTTFNVIYLGFTCGDSQVGLYTTATKFFMVLLGLYTALTRVMIPRMSALYANHDSEGFRNLLQKTINALLTISIPLIVFCCIFSRGIISLFAGNDFIEAYIPSLIVFPLIFIIGYEQILVLQVLLPIKKDKALLTGAIIGSIVGLSANVVFVHYFQAIGSAMAWVLAETSVLISGQYFVKKYVGATFPVKSFVSNVTAYIPLVLILAALYLFIPVRLLSLLAGIFTTTIYAALIQIWCLKNDFALSMLRTVLPFIR